MRKVIENLAGQGEALLVRSLSCGLRIFRKALGAGALTAFTAVAKIALVGAHASTGIHDLLLAFNYMGSFLLMRLLGFSLATKIPSIVAATWIWARTRKPFRLQWAVQSPLVAAMGNLVAVIPVAIVLDFVHRSMTGRPLLGAAAALRLLSAHSPEHSSTILFAAITGIILWISNWAGGVLGRAVFSDIILGTLLAMTPAVARVFGHRVEVRHLTLSTGAVTLAVCSLGFQRACDYGLPGAIFGLGWIAILNLGLSFLISWVLSREFVAGIISES